MLKTTGRRIWLLNMNDMNSRLDHAIAALDALCRPSSSVECYFAAMESLNGMELTGASEDVQQAIESFGLQYNSILQKYPADPSDALPKLSDADVTRLTASIRAVSLLIRDTETERIMNRLHKHGGKLPEGEVIEARRHRDWFVPLLLQACRNQIEELKLLNDPDERLPEDQYSSVPFFSLFLFSEWETVESKPIILEGLKLPGEGPFELFGDGVHEQLPRFLAQFLSDEIDRIDELIRDPNVNTYVRWSSASSYKYLVRDKNITIDEAVSHLGNLFRNTKVVGTDGRPGMGHCYELSAGIISVVHDLGGSINSIFRDDDQNWNFVEETIFSREDAQQPFNESQSVFGLKSLPPTCMSDTLESLRNWATFQPRPEPKQRPATAKPSEPAMQRVEAMAGITPSFDSKLSQPTVKLTRQGDRVQRNARCPCGSGKKYKHCCMRK